MKDCEVDLTRDPNLYVDNSKVSNSKEILIILKDRAVGVIIGESDGGNHPSLRIRRSKIV